MAPAMQYGRSNDQHTTLPPWIAPDAAPLSMQASHHVTAAATGLWLSCANPRHAALASRLRPDGADSIETANRYGSDPSGPLLYATPVLPNLNCGMQTLCCRAE
ncbi:MAG TPA: hypothetical protein ENO21_00450 [Firmicutes bacterium]|nr:hypothetical protein [Bacillota bacterium]